MHCAYSPVAPAVGLSTVSSAVQCPYCQGIYNVETDNSVHLAPIFKNAWSYNSTALYVFMAWCLIKHRESYNL